jgi:hypothetical protein
LDEQGRAERGSQLQMQIYANHRREELSAAILSALPDLGGRASGLEWRSPLREQNFAEYQDAAFLDAIGCGDLGEELNRFWPARGPVWDGLATAKLDSGSDGVVLVEGKSYPGEIYGPGSQAGESGSERGKTSRERIRAAIAATQEALGAEDVGPDDWIGRGQGAPGSLYQMANRLAHLHWLRSRGRQAWLGFICFVEDPTFNATTREEWETELPKTWQRLGLSGAADGVAEVFLQGRPATELA